MIHQLSTNNPRRVATGPGYTQILARIMRSRPAARVPGGPTGAQQPRPASCSLSVSPYITTRRCYSPAGPGLGPHKTSSSRPASNLAHFNIRQIWTISTPVNRHFPFYFHHTTTVSSRQPFLCPHERSTCYVFWFTPVFQARLQDTRKTPRIDYLLQLLGCARLLDISLKTALKNHIPYTRVEISHTNLPLATSHNSPIQIFPYVHSPSRRHPTPFQETKATSRTR